MPDPTKTGFWQTVPGLMTATAGILSAATGAIVALNQTGVVDFKQIAGAKPATQTAPVEVPPAAAPPSENKPPAGIVEPASTVADTKRQEPIAASPPPVSKPDSQQAKLEPEPVVEPKKPAATDEVATRPAPVVPRPPYDPRPQPRTEPVRPRPDVPESVVETKRPEGSASPSSTRQDEAKQAEPEKQTTTAPASRAAEQVPPASPGRDDATRAKPDAPERVAKAGKQEQPPKPSHPPDDAKKSKAVRQDPDEPRAVGKAKATAAQQPPSDEKKDRGPGAADEKKKTEPTPASTPPGQLALTGVKFSLPSGWVKEEIQPAPMAPVAVYRIPKADPTSDDGAVRITHFPNMKGKEMDERNIDRWIGQVTKPDGSPMTRADAKVSTEQAGSAKLTIVDMTGAVKMTMRDSAKPNHRMIAAIVDHPQGPHFVVAVGPAASMEKWAKDVDSFLKSAKVD